MTEQYRHREFIGAMGLAGRRGVFAFSSRGARLEVDQVQLRRHLILPQLFSPRSPWRQNVTSLGTVPDNRERTRAVFDILREFSLLQLTTRLHDNPLGQTCNTFSERFKLIWEHGGLAQSPFVSVDDFSFPIADVKRDGSVVVKDKLLLERYGGGEGYPDDSIQVERQAGKLYALNIPQPAGEIRPGGPQSIDSDGNVVLIDLQAGKAYDFWQATTARDGNMASRGGGITGNEILAAGSVSVYELAGLGAYVPGGLASGGGRASGLSYLAGLLIPEDLAKGDQSVISHAFAFGLPRLRNLPDGLNPALPNFRYPADSTERTAFTNNPFALVAGERIRLKRFSEIQGMQYVDPKGRTKRVPLDMDSMAPITRIFLTALQEYGAYLVDGAGAFSFAAEDFRTARVELSDEEVGRLIGGQFPNPNLPDETKWEAIVGTLNEQLCCNLFGDGATALPFAADYLLSKPEDGSFHANFDVVPSPIPPGTS